MPNRKPQDQPRYSRPTTSNALHIDTTTQVPPIGSILYPTMIRPLHIRPSLLISPSPSILPNIQTIPRLTRFKSTSTTDLPATANLSPRWLSDVKTRIGKCVMFGINKEQTQEAGSILHEVNQDWRELVAGSEGFLTGEEWRGLYRQEVVWGEMDSMGHVNNVMYNRYAESARVNWTRNFAASDAAHRVEWKELMSPRGIGLILRSIKTDYKFPMKWPDRITVLHKLRDKPTLDSDHFILDVLILSEAQRRASARCVEDIVTYDYRTARKTTLPRFMVDKFRETFELQEQAKEKNSSRVRGLLARVRDLEKCSWDRLDAKEDFGSAATS
ncbi:Thioesterase/thiol ester dehydrase-isomerase [Plenodomus tracheiphilus IPT5]|uniref:Thioesterase/thiol ester dehydrase-isomerase n=1 Tax=Plenodomus tracheiphilus IPT5 TaxID=1408161 RepID=A0A6A7B1Y3_9PLEO|nr:Thioesterase/thiol ester dehydrase-isomerase [Plenodomus tracheiphilus IPT5]